MGASRIHYGSLDHHSDFLFDHFGNGHGNGGLVLEWGLGKGVHLVKYRFSPISYTKFLSY